MVSDLGQATGQASTQTSSHQSGYKRYETQTRSSSRFSSSHCRTILQARLFKQRKPLAGLSTPFIPVCGALRIPRSKSQLGLGSSSSIRRLMWTNSRTHQNPTNLTRINWLAKDFTSILVSSFNAHVSTQASHKGDLIPTGKAAKGWIGGDDNS